MKPQNTHSKRYKRLISLVIMSVTLCSGSFDSAYSQTQTIGLEAGFVNLTGGDGPDFTLQPSFGANFGQRLSDSWNVTFSLSRQRLFNDSTAGSSLSLGYSKDNSTARWSGTRLGLIFDRYLLSPDNNFNVSLGAGGGLLVWKMLDPVEDTILSAASQKNQLVDYSASEVFLSIQSGLHFGLSGRLLLSVQTRADYLTGAGSEFSESIESSRNRWQLGSFLSLKMGFGGESNTSWQPVQRLATTYSATNRHSSARGTDSDNDGVPDEKDNCPYNEPGVTVDSYGCPIDSDFDGVPDGLDHCPATPADARETVDIYGCATDADFDGLADFIDGCPHNPVGAAVDSSGCPIDSDNDGVPDGLDDCPYTLQGVEVDRFGCIDLAIIDKPLVLNIDYAPGSFEVDPVNREKLKKLATMLNFVKDVRIEINGYTDNIGTSLANRRLSEKRAARVSQFLVSFGVASDRIKVFGKGETNFVASNQTSEGRSRNRRIEIVFYK